MSQQRGFCRDETDHEQPLHTIVVKFGPLTGLHGVHVLFRQMVSAGFFGSAPVVPHELLLAAKAIDPQLPMPIRIAHAKQILADN